MKYAFKSSKKNFEDLKDFIMAKKSLTLKIVGCISSFLFFSNSAQAEEKNIDIYGGIGYTNLSGFSFDTSKNVFNKFNGYQLGLFGLYTFENDSNLKFSIGSGLQITKTKNQDTSTDIQNVDSLKANFDYTSFIFHSGINYKLTNSISMYFLGNFGYTLKNTFNVDLDTNDNYARAANNSTSYTINNHFFYGATLMGAYKISEIFSLGSSFIYNRHTMTLNYKTYPSTVTERSSFNEYSMNLLFIWSI